MAVVAASMVTGVVVAVLDGLEETTGELGTGDDDAVPAPDVPAAGDVPAAVEDVAAVEAAAAVELPDAPVAVDPPAAVVPDGAAAVPLLLEHAAAIEDNPTAPATRRA